RQTTHLSISNNNINQDGAIMIANELSIPECNLEYIDLGNNPIEEAGMIRIAIASRNRNSKIKRIDHEIYRPIFSKTI
ncbi:MAG: hypothetical protein ACK56I_18185, partial [bacterium]